MFIDHLVLGLKIIICETYSPVVTALMLSFVLENCIHFPNLRDLPLFLTHVIKINVNLESFPPLFIKSELIHPV